MSHLHILKKTLFFFFFVFPNTLEPPVCVCGLLVALLRVHGCERPLTSARSESHSGQLCTSVCLYL